MNGEKRRAELRRLGGRPFHGMGDVVQLEVEEDPLARPGEPAHERKPVSAVGELHTYLVKGRRLADRLDETLGLVTSET